VISGEEEGTFGWVAVNYLQNTLSADPSTTIGALDMGGASTQITFAPQDEVLSSYFPVHLNGNYYPLYTQFVF
jgi:apyrase